MSLPTRWLLLLLLILGGCRGWILHETDHLSVRYRPDSYAALNIERAAAQYDAMYLSLEESIPGFVASQRYKLYLHDDSRRFGWSNSFMGSVHYLYSEAVVVVSPHEMMHLALDEVNSWAPGRLEEGVCRFHENRFKTVEGRQIRCALYRYARLEPEEDWQVQPVFRGRGGVGIANIAAAFVAYMRETAGEERFWEFYQEVTSCNWKQRLQRFMGQDLEQIDRAFADWVRALEPPPVELQDYR